MGTRSPSEVQNSVSRAGRTKELNTSSKVSDEECHVKEHTEVRIRGQNSRPDPKHYNAGTSGLYTSLW